MPGAFDETLLPHGAAAGGLPNPDTDDPDAKPFWDACCEHRLVVQRCAECGRHRSPPQPACFRCQSLEFEWKEVPPEGAVYSFAVAHHPVHPSLRTRTPYVIVVVELDQVEGERIVGNYLGDRQTIAIGQRVKVRWEDVEDGLSLAQWEASERVVGGDDPPPGVARPT